MSTLGAVCRALWWQVRALRRAVARSVRLLRWLHLVLGATVAVGWRVAATSVVVATSAVWLTALAWPRLHSRSWRAVVERWHTVRWFRRRWTTLADHCGLSVQRPSRQPGVPSFTVVPRLMRVRVKGPVVRLHMRLTAGLTVADVERAASRLAVAANVPRVLVEPEGNSGARLTLTVRDLLRNPFPSTLPAPDTVDLSRAPSTVVVGRIEDGSSWQVRVGPSTLVAGCAGSGKGSILWGLVLGLGPWVKSGVIRLHGIDLKGGMELLLGRDLFTTMATTPEEAVVVLEVLAAACTERTSTLAGIVRTHTPTVAEPLQLLVVDELAAVTAYLGDRQLRDRADRALSVLLSQGRAPGFVVWAFLQDPRKDVVPQRGLFQVTIGMRLRDTSETAMVFGDGALVDLAPCHRITRTTPGIGYVLPEGGGNPVRVRAGYTDDDTIRHAAHLYATATRHRLDVARPAAHPERQVKTSSDGQWPERGPRAPRAPRTPRQPSTPRTPRQCENVAEPGQVEEKQVLPDGFAGAVS
jgi:S-DNA-T family DNA segregation ATPase FtsK/SpoIIIE